MVFKKNDEYWVSIFIIFFGTKCEKNNRSISGVFEDWRPIFVKVKMYNLLYIFCFQIWSEIKKTPCCGGYFFLHESRKNDK